MLKDNDRLCDVCGSDISKGENYRVSMVPEQNALLFKSIIDSAPHPDLVPTTTADPKGNIRLDICLECHMNMGLQATEHAN